MGKGYGCPIVCASAWYRSIPRLSKCQWSNPEEYKSWWRHQMETFTALLALYAGNSPVAGEFPSQRPVTRIFDVFFDRRLNKRSSKQSWAGDLRRLRTHYDVIVMWMCHPNTLRTDYISATEHGTTKPCGHLKGIHCLDNFIVSETYIVDIWHDI